MRDASAPGALVALRSLATRLLTGLMPALPAAVAVAAVAAAAQDDLRTTSRAQVQAGGLVHAHPGTTEVLDGLVPARHTAVAPPSSARCRARYGRQACRQSDRCRAHLLRHRSRCTAPCRHCRPAAPTACAPASPHPATARAPAWPPCRAARRAQSTFKTKPAWRPTITRLTSKPPPHQRIVSDPDRRSQSPLGARSEFDTLQRNSSSTCGQ